MNNTEVIGYIKQSFELKNQGFYKPAIEMLYKALSIDGDNIEILLQLAYLYRLLENYQRAIYYIEKVLDFDNKQMDCLILLEEIHLLQGKLELARDVGQKIYSIEPSSKNLAGLIKVLNKLNDFESVKKMENEVLELDKDALYEFALAHYNNSDVVKALEFLNKSFEIDNNNDQVRFLLGKIYFDQKNFAKSKEIFAGFKKISKKAKVLNYLGLFAMNENKYTEAVDYFSKAIKVYDKKPEFFFNLGSAHFLNGWLDEALKNFNQAVCLDSDNIEYHYSLAYLYYQKKIYAKALLELDFIFSISKEHGLANILKAMIIAKQGDLFTAKSKLEDSIKSNPGYDLAYSALSQIHKDLGQVEQAKKYLEKAIEIKPESLNYLSDFIELEIEQNNYEKALELNEKLIDINDKYIPAYISLSKINVALKDFGYVYDSAQNIIELDSNCPEGYYYNSIALFEQGDEEFAIASLKKAISIDVNNASLYFKMSEFYQELGDFQKAYDWAKEAGDIDEKNYKIKWLCAKLAATLKNQDAATKYYSQSYRLASTDKDLCEDYSHYLRSIGKEKQANKLLKI